MQEFLSLPLSHEAGQPDNNFWMCSLSHLSHGRLSNWISLLAPSLPKCYPGQRLHPNTVFKYCSQGKVACWCTQHWHPTPEAHAPKAPIYASVLYTVALHLFLKLDSSGMYIVVEKCTNYTIYKSHSSYPFTQHCHTHWSYTMAQSL